MKARWLLITLLLAFPFAFAFFLSEARLREKRSAKAALVVPPPVPSALVAQPSAPIETPVERALPQPSQTEPQTDPTPSPAAAADEEIVQFDHPFTVPTEKPLLLEGTVTKESNALVYESDAKLQLPNNVFLSSPTGVMVSDEQQKIFAGDMQLLSTKQTISANEAVLTLQPGGSSVLTSKTLIISSNDESIPAMELKGDNLTLTIPAKKTPAASPETSVPTATPSPAPAP